MISLSDDELAAIMDAAAPLQPHQRSDFLRDVSQHRAGEVRGRRLPADQPRRRRAAARI